MSLNKFLEEETDEEIPEPPKQDDNGYFATFKVKFETHEDMVNFFDVVDQTFHYNQKEIEFPPREKYNNSITDFLGE